MNARADVSMGSHQCPESVTKTCAHHTTCKTFCEIGVDRKFSEFRPIYMLSPSTQCVYSIYIVCMFSYA